MRHLSDTWTEPDLETLVHKREVEKKRWAVIASEMNRPLATCFHRYNAIRLARAPSIVPQPRPGPRPLHEQLGIRTFVHRQAILCDPNGRYGNSRENTNDHTYRVNVTLAKVCA